MEYEESDWVKYLFASYLTKADAFSHPGAFRPFPM